MGVYKVVRSARKADGVVVEVVEIRGNSGSAHAIDGALRDPLFFSKFETTDGAPLVVVDKKTLRNAEGTVFELVD